jgi:hypothetical protein
MNFCENGIKLIKQSKHENLYEYDVLNYLINILLI